MTREHIIRIARNAAVIVITAGTLASCKRADDAPKVPLKSMTSADSARAMASAHAMLGLKARAQLDSGNIAYRHGDYPLALVHYRAASELAPQHAAPFFGIYMVARATSRRQLADSALEAIRIRNGPMTPVQQHLPGDSTLRRLHDALAHGATAG